MRKVVVIILSALLLSLLAFDFMGKPPKGDTGVIRGRPAFSEYELSLDISNEGNTNEVTNLQIIVDNITGQPEFEAESSASLSALEPGESKEVIIELSDNADPASSYIVSGHINYTEEGSNETNYFSLSVNVN